MRTRCCLLKIGCHCSSVGLDNICFGMLLLLRAVTLGITRGQIWVIYVPLESPGLVLLKLKPCGADHIKGKNPGGQL